ncbi:MAG: hypothetical protein EXX96DRAFT_639176 [Benjaminiella poitrasii]|nr:MAG: hypothetical protein EXX96DRAFT_639176 [Benjaminiella poitrasii]
MVSFIYEDGQGKMFDSEGDKVYVLEMEVDDANFSLDNITTFTEYMELKPPEKPVNERKATFDKAKNESNLDQANKPSINTHRKYKKENMGYFLYLVNEKEMPVRGAA